MIALHLPFAGAELSPPAASRFANSLTVGTNRKPVLAASGGAHFATACAPPHRPIHLPSGDILLFHGHIANRAELRGLLGSAPLDDAALYAAAWKAWGEDADLRVIGEFCTILCHPEQRRARIARAPLAGPPLHYYQDDQRLIVASTPRAIFATGLVEQAVDEQKIADTLLLNYCEGDRGWFKDIARVPASTRIMLAPGKRTSDVYYDPLALPSVRLRSDEAYVEAANALLEEGTRAALDGFSRPAISISGGLDSQAVAAHALNVLPEHTRLMGFTSVPEAGWEGDHRATRFGDERDHVRRFADMHPRFDMTLIDAPGLSFDHHLQSMFLLGGAAPRNAMNLHWIHEVHSAARKRGADVLLTGGLGNLTFSFDGKTRLQSLLRNGQWRALLHEMRAVNDGRSFLRRLGTIALPLLPTGVQRLRHQLAGRPKPDPFPAYSAIDPAYAADMRVFERAADLGHDPQFTKRTSSHAVRKAMIGNAFQEVGDILQAMELLHGVPQRDPTAYRPLLEFCFSIPDDQYLRDGQTRWLARRMLRGMIPDVVLHETRRGRQAADWQLRLDRQRPALQAELENLAQDPAMARRLDLASLRQTVDEWSNDAPLSDDQRTKLQLALPRALATARFIRYVEGQNAF